MPAVATVVRIGLSAKPVASGVQFVLVFVPADDLAHRRLKSAITIPVSVVGDLVGGAAGARRWRTGRTSPSGVPS